MTTQQLLFVTLCLAACAVSGHVILGYNSSAACSGTPMTTVNVPTDTCTAVDTTYTKIGVHSTGSCFAPCATPSALQRCDSCEKPSSSSTVYYKWSCNSTHASGYTCTDSACGSCTLATALSFGTCPTGSGASAFASTPAACSYASFALYSDSSCTTAATEFTAYCDTCYSTFKITCAAPALSLTLFVVSLAAALSAML